MERSAQGWYRDPYRIHEDRYFSEGLPTKLVRDAGEEAYDPPPDLPVPEVLIPVVPDSPEDTNGADLRRADEAADEPPYDSGRATRAVMDILDQLPKP